MNSFSPPQAYALALHCSGASGRQWQTLKDLLTPTMTVIAPDLLGYGENPPMHSLLSVTLAQEAEHIIALIDGIGSPVHLVGHSYGGAVALRVALSRPNAIASLSLYEPSAFRLLQALGASAVDARSEIRAVVDDVCRDLALGRADQAMERFYDYWSSGGNWKRLPAGVQSALVKRVRKVPADFAALFGDPMELRHLRRLNMPSLVMIGQHGPAPSRLVAGAVARVLPRGRLQPVAGAGHMGPLTHAETVATLIAQHIGSSGVPAHSRSFAIAA